MIQVWENVPNKDYYDKRYKMAPSVVDGLKVRSSIPNISSIQSSLYHYDILEGVREIPVSDFNVKDPSNLFYSVDDTERVRELAEQISTSGEISPLIIVVDEETESEGPYVLEGEHRFTALLLMGKKVLPALVVIEYE